MKKLIFGLLVVTTLALIGCRSYDAYPSVDIRHLGTYYADGGFDAYYIVIYDNVLKMVEKNRTVEYRAWTEGASLMIKDGGDKVYGTFIDYVVFIEIKSGVVWRRK